MRAYVVTTGIVFGIVTVAHLWRMSAESRMAAEPWYILITIATGALCVWAWLVVPRSGRT